MSRYSKDSYQKMFDAMLSSELYFTASAATENNILCAMKRILGQCIKSGGILLYSDLRLDEELNVHFTIKDPDGDVISLILYYGA